MQALMLAAGMGKRLGRYTQNGTKCMVQINGKALIEYAIEALVKSGVKKFTLVVGYRSDVLKNYIQSKFNEDNLCGMKIDYIENPVYDKTNNIYSLYLARDVLSSDDTILLESDLIFDKEIIREIVSSPEKNLAVVSHFENWMDGTVTVLNEEKAIKRIVSKSDFDWNKIDSYYKTVNIYKFSKEFSKNIYMPFLGAYQTAYSKNEYYETVLKVISYLDGDILKAHLVDGSRWYEIDDPADLKIASTRFSSGKEHLESMYKTFGGYWRYPAMLDFCYLVNPYFPPKALVNEMKQMSDILLESYPSGDKQQSLLAGKIFGVLPEHIAVGNGAAELIASISELSSGKVVVPFPTFNEYPNRFGNENTVWLPANEDFSYSVEDIVRSAEENSASYVLLINPDNPSGHFFTKQEVIVLAEQLSSKNVKLILDESFVDFAEPEIRFTFIDEELISKHKNVIVIKSISKSYGVPGIRLGVLVSGDESLIEKIQKNTSIWNINSFAEFFLQIFDKYKKFYGSACDKIAEERGRFSSELSKIPGVKVYESQANYLLCKLSGEAEKIGSLGLAEKLLDGYNILIKDLSSKKGFENGQFIRLAVRNCQDNDRLIFALKEIFS